MNVLIAIFAIIGTIFFVFLIALLGFYISISYGEDTDKLTDKEIKQITKLFNNQNKKHHAL